jgi:hypothetical protein
MEAAVDIEAPGESVFRQLAGIERLSAHSTEHAGG